MPLRDDYLRSLAARRTSPGTQRTAASVLGIVERYCGKPLEALTVDDLARWQAWRAERLSTRSLRTQTSYVLAAFAWAVAEERVQLNPARRLRPPKAPRTLPRPIPEARLWQAFAAADDVMRAILGLAAFAGLRAAEVAGLDWRDLMLDDAEPHLRVTGKGGHERVVDVSPELATILLALPHRRGPVIRRARTNGHHTATYVSKIANEHLRSCGVPDTYHALRHRFATELTRVGGIRRAQEALGHASPSTTALYARVTRADLRPSVVAVGRLLEVGA